MASKQINDLEAEVVARISALADQKADAIREFVGSFHGGLQKRHLNWLSVLAKRDPESVRGFLVEHERELAPRVLREVNNKLVSGLKNARWPGR